MIASLQKDLATTCVDSYSSIAYLRVYVKMTTTTIPMTISTRPPISIGRGVVGERAFSSFSFGRLFRLSPLPSAIA
jgi:hypothetical protein